MKLLAKGYSIDICSRMDSLQEKLQEDQRPRWNDMKEYLNKIQLDAKKATKEQNPLSDICKRKFNTKTL